MKKLDPIISRLAYQTLIPGLELAIQRLQEELEGLKMLVAPESVSVVQQKAPAKVPQKARARKNGSAKWWSTATPAQKRRRLEAMAGGKQRREAKAA